MHLLFRCFFQPFNVSSDLVVCPSCSKRLQDTFDFKMMCLNNDNQIKTFHGSNDDYFLNLEQTFPKKLCLDGPVKSEGTKVCRFCLKHCIIYNCIDLEKMGEDIFLRDLISKSVPEIVSMTNNSFTYVSSLLLIKLP